jgi:hypothetical protein
MLTEPQTITSPSGDTLVVLPKAEYDRLVAIAEEAAEDAADLAAHLAAKADPEGSKLLSPEESAAVLRRARGEQ